MQTQKKLSPMTAAILSSMPAAMKAGEIKVAVAGTGGRSMAGMQSITSAYEMCAYMRGAISTGKMQYKEIAKRAGCCTKTVSNLASGETKDPRFNTCVNILRALGHKVYATR